MIELTAVFQQALSKRQSWTRTSFLKNLHEISQIIPQSIVDWDEGVPENWGRIMADDEVLSLVCRRCPIVIIKEKIAQSVGQLENIQTLIVESMSENLFMVDKEVIEELAGRRVPDNVDYGACSIDDLWWATVS